MTYHHKVKMSQDQKKIFNNWLKIMESMTQTKWLIHKCSQKNKIQLKIYLRNNFMSHKVVKSNMKILQNSKII